MAPDAQLQIRPATPNDIIALHAFAKSALHLDSFTPALLHEKLFAPLPGPSLWETLIAERAGEPVGFMQTLARKRAQVSEPACPHAAASKAWIGLFAVHPAHRHRGIARRLHEAARARWPDDVKEAEVLAIPGNYLTPGLDPRYTAALCFLEALGYRRGRDCVNMRVDLAHALDTAAEESRLEAAGITLRRANDTDAALLDAFFAADFGPDWRYEAALAANNDPPALHVALREGRILGFAAHSAQNREWGFFGPMGTAPAARGAGLGRVLLWRCLNDLRAAGHATAIIPWVGPIAFYHQACGATVERVFWRYRMEVP